MANALTTIEIDDLMLDQACEILDQANVRHTAAGFQFAVTDRMIVMLSPGAEAVSISLPC